MKVVVLAVLLALFLAPPAVASFHPAAPISTSECPAGGGACFTNGTIYLGAGASRFERQHEIGHAFDAEVLTDSQRADFQRMMRAPAGPWFAGTGFPAGLHSPAEWFADYYAVCLARINPRQGWPDSYAPRPTLRRFLRVCNAIKFVSFVHQSSVTR